MLRLVCRNNKLQAIEMLFITEMLEPTAAWRKNKLNHIIQNEK